MRLLYTLSAVLLASGSLGCGQHVHEVEKYVLLRAQPGSADSLEDGPFRIRAVISGVVRSSRPGSTVFVDSKGTSGGPYTLHVVASYYGQPKGICKLHEITLQIGDRDPVILHSRDAPRVNVEFGPWLDHAVSGRHDIDLGGDLHFQTEDVVTVTVSFQSPGSERIQTLRAAFVGRRTKSSSSKLDDALRG